MLTLPPSVKVHIAVEPCDMRKQFDGLALLVEQVLRHEARSGHLFVFLNKRATHVRIIFWDRNGYCLVSKRLERVSPAARRGSR
jgi:transposase